MKTIESRPRAYLLTVCLFAACVASMAVMASAGPPKGVEPSERVEKLREPRIIQNVPCTRYARFDADGRLLSCILSQEHAFGRVVLPANTQIRRFHPDGSPKDVHLGREARYDGHLCRGEGPGEWMSGFTPDGRLEYCFLVERETIDGVLCERGTFWGEITGGVIVRFHPDGRLKTCRLAAGAQVTGRTYRKGERIWLDPQGSPLPEPAKQQGG
jgi:hypothetical protein